MPKKDFEWENGVLLKDHTRKKHAILRAYFSEYLHTRCQNRRQERFRLVVVDGFAGGGLYQCGTPGSPIIFLDCLRESVARINTQRFEEGFNPVEIDCLLLLNEKDSAGLELLRRNITPYEQATKGTEGLNLWIEYYNQPFDNVYPIIKKRILGAKCKSVFFNLDQSGYSQATEEHVRDIMSSWPRAEVLLTFMVSTLLAFISRDTTKSRVPLDPTLQESVKAVLNDNSLMARSEFLGAIEKVAYENLKSCAPFVSPFSIKNPAGWHYWLMHFANVARARQVYNDVLHMDGNTQGHFGRSGLKMLAYDPDKYTGQIYLFDKDARQRALDELYDDIPRFVAEEGDVMSVGRFYEAAYSETPAHSDDIHRSMIDNPDVEVLTPNGGSRREAKTIRPEDVIKLKPQKSFYFGF
ncbi:three-Cys-motif partner protein TcmP [Algiphilus aromaticivorans]|uniref:three-Cys-motif partner protein TcmP n=1 Tax=Algiphilus aromaticivorans TaxID=382454 RepID=UPI0005C177B1|nr:three-Cys-motif partner protein TcmP [Algiphilus aromaticivorans]